MFNTQIDKFGLFGGKKEIKKPICRQYFGIRRFFFATEYCRITFAFVKLITQQNNNFKLKKT